MFICRNPDEIAAYSFKDYILHPKMKVSVFLSQWWGGGEWCFLVVFFFSGGWCFFLVGGAPVVFVIPTFWGGYACRNMSVEPLRSTNAWLYQTLRCTTPKLNVDNISIPIKLKITASSSWRTDRLFWKAIKGTTLFVNAKPVSLTLYSVLNFRIFTTRYNEHPRPKMFAVSTPFPFSDSFLRLQFWRAHAHWIKAYYVTFLDS